MKKALFAAAVISFVTGAQGQTTQPRIVSRPGMSAQVTVVEVALHFVTAIRVPEIVNSVVVGDPALFQVEHSEHEPQLVFVKVLTNKPAETNLLISTAKGRQLSLLVVSKGDQAQQPIDFLVNYQPERSFVIEPAGLSAAVSQTVAVAASSLPDGASGRSSSESQVSINPTSQGGIQGNAGPSLPVRQGSLDKLLARQEQAPLPTLYGEHTQGGTEVGERVRAGIGDVIDGGQEVIALFSVVNPQNQAILLMPPQIQLGGKARHGKLIKHSKWTTADQLAVVDYRLSKRRLAPSERADGVVLFERPPFKQSNETLFLQMAEAGAVDHPALAPIGFGISTSEEEDYGRTNSGK
jgi:hypothetical protein